MSVNLYVKVKVMNKELVAVFLGASLLVTACGEDLTPAERQILAEAKKEQATIERITLPPVVGDLEAGHYRVKADIGGVPHECNLSISSSRTYARYDVRNEVLNDCVPTPAP